jgi:serine/alanine adding enzyme
MQVAAGDWNALLARLGLDDVYLRREYVESASLIEPGRVTFLHFDGVIFPCLVRDFDHRADVATPYGYGGPVAADRASADAFYAAYENWCAEHRIVSTFIRFHPLYANHRYAGVHIEPHGETIAWRLQGDDLFERLHAHHRRAVRKAQRAELAVSVEERPPLAEFVTLYNQTMARVDASSFYLFTADYWDSLARLPCVLVSARREAELAAAVLCFAAEPWLHYHLGASSEEGRALGASNLVLFEAGKWARDRGYELLHLGGGVRGHRDSLFEFKRRFDPGGEREFAVGKAVHDEEAYRELAGRVELDGFFPAYRDTSRR